MKICLFNDSLVCRSNNVLNQKYDLFRSHYLIYEFIARYFNCNELYEWQEGTNSNIVLDYMSLPVIPTKSNKFNLGIICHCNVNADNYDSLVNFIDNCNSIIYYNSDPEFNNEEYIEATQVLRFVKDNPYSKLANLFHKKCKLILVSTYEQVYLIKYKFSSIDVRHIPQLINPNIVIPKQNKYYDIFLINNSKTYKELVIDLLNQGFKVLTLTSGTEAVVPGVTGCYSCQGNGCDYFTLLTLVGQCKYYLGTNTYWSQNISYQYEPYCSNTHTSKLIESYYANTLPIPSAVTRNKLIEFIRDTEESYDQYLNIFINWMDNYKLENYKNKLETICKNIKEYLY